MKFLVTYIVDRYFQGEDGLRYRAEGHSLTVEAENKVKAFIAAYEHLTEKGHMVCTVAEVQQDDERTLELYGGEVSNGPPGVASLSSTETQQVYDAGIS